MSLRSRAAASFAYPFLPSHLAPKCPPMCPATPLVVSAQPYLLVQARLSKSQEPPPSTTGVAVSLPQKDTENASARTEEIKQMRAVYQWTHTGIADASLVDGIPEQEQPNDIWVKKMTSILARVKRNRKAINANPQPRLAGHVQEIFQEYKDLFIDIDLPLVAKLNQFLGDDVFGWCRVAGLNPMKLTKLVGLPTIFFPGLTDDIFQGIGHFAGDSLQVAATEGRLFTVDYAELKDVQTGSIGNTYKDGYFVYAPRALLAIPKNPGPRTGLLPIAIQCGQDDTFPVYSANKSHTDPFTWLAAKLTVQVSDALVHSLTYHLGRTHLLLEVVICAAYRTMPQAHPVLRLLESHFEGTVFINHNAIETLMNPGGTIDQITAPQIETTHKIAASSINDPSFSFNEWMPDLELDIRGVKDAPQLNYPYRDDALALWDAINNWVSAYISAYYKTDGDVVGDYELANWCREISDESLGNLHGFCENADGTMNTVQYLIRAVSMIIFTASAQHSAVNFPQGTILKFAPAMPLCGYAAAPKTEKPFNSREELVLAMCPSLENAQLQLNAAERIGVMQYTTLGKYGDRLDFAPEEVRTALETFQITLDRIGLDITARNEIEEQAELPQYAYLLPKRIPHSINI